MKKIKVFCKNLRHFHHQMLRPRVVVIQVARCRVRTGALLQSLEAGRATGFMTKVKLQCPSRKQGCVSNGSSPTGKLNLHSHPIHSTKK